MVELETLLEKWKSQKDDDAAEGNLVTQIIKSTSLIFNTKREKSLKKPFWLDFLNTTKKPVFLKALKTSRLREEWVKWVFKIIQSIDYNLRDMMEQRVAAHPDLVLFKDMSSALAIDWTYVQIFRHLREIAGGFYRTVPNQPRVAIYTENCLEGACTDLACLMFGIFDTPLSPHFKIDVLLSIFNELKINIALADTEDRLALLEKIRDKTDVKFQIFSLQPATSKTRNIPYLVEEGKKISRWDNDVTLARQPVRQNNMVATTMFTSGSTGFPKGVSFSIYNIVSKRFARAAALPEVGNELFLSYLPLYHTFGRYLEMTGAIFWDGTYIFTGNTSAETLLSLFPKTNPSGFISIPLRWQELYDRCQETIGSVGNPDLCEKAVREVVGNRLHWGLSAAGYLDPAVFHFFNLYGIHLNSGFGMTEATGGITMTPSGTYRDFSVGIPLPGISTRLRGDSELEISGHYVGRYLEDAGPGDTICYPDSQRKDYWLATGDVFKISKDGHYQIIDRIKDIYKNNRGQTVAPQVVEKKFYKVPGIKNVFLVGDNRPYNVLLIVPDREDSLFRALSGENQEEYFHQIVMKANNDVATYERVINFTLLNRDFSGEKGEITPKGSFNRKVIESNFRDIIEKLYQSNTVRISGDGFTINIPKWLFRDLGILETDIVYQSHRLVNRRNRMALRIKKYKGNWFQVGDLRYFINSDLIDLGIFTRQPKIWTGNPELISFFPVKEGWDIPLGSISSNISLSGFRKLKQTFFPEFKSVRDNMLIRANNLLFNTYYRDFEEALVSLEELGKILGTAEPRLTTTLRHRLEALAYHPEEEIRCLAYRLILLKVPRPEDIAAMPPFIESGLSFLNEKSIREIASSNFGKHRLDALKQRLYYYRTNLKWPATKKRRRAFEDVLGMLYNFAVTHMEYYVPMRAELSRWILHKQDPYLSKIAEKYFYQLASVFEKEIESKSKPYSIASWKSKLVFEHGISDTEKQSITKIFRTTTFLHESIVLTFNEKGFDLAGIPDQGIWILRLLAYKEFKHYRLSINTIGGKHYDLHMVMSENPSKRPSPDTFYWLASLAGFPHEPAVAPLLGSSRPNLGILTTQYIGGLTAWDKIRELSEIHRSSGYIRANAWKKIFIKSFAVIFKAWHHSGYQIVPGSISPSNVSIPEMDFRENALVLSLAGWSKYKNTLSLVSPMLQDYYCKTASLYPWCRKQLDVNWIFDACIEALGIDEASGFLKNLQQDIGGKSMTCFDRADIQTFLDQYIQSSLKKYYLPVALFSAIDQYQDWYKMNQLTTLAAKEQTMGELMELYKLNQYLELVRFYFYRHTYFSESSSEIQTAFDFLIDRMHENHDGLAIQLIELSDLQSVLKESDDKNVFNRMVFPRIQGNGDIDFLKVGQLQKEHVVVRFPIQDKSGKRYTLREPIEPRETGQLYQLFFRENYPKDISDNDHQYIVTDETDKIIGGLTWRYLEDENVFLDGIVVTASLQGKGIASGMIKSFFTSMAARGVKIVKAHFLLGNYYLKHYFEVDKQWGALIKTLK
ncbi:MAG: AMP-binding protein [Bacteroidales bacterium]|jgi:long-subunit acyl-CoA synthetase (AMP-forming)|nr:AMP-binding protein [Bacteroidales bacterium]